MVQRSSSFLTLLFKGVKCAFTNLPPPCYDCVHYCLPGAPDVFNGRLLHLVKQRLHTRQERVERSGTLVWPKGRRGGQDRAGQDREGAVENRTGRAGQGREMAERWWLEGAHAVGAEGGTFDATAGAYRSGCGALLCCCGRLPVVLGRGPGSCGGPRRVAKVSAPGACSLVMRYFLGRAPGSCLVYAKNLGVKPRFTI